MKVFLVHVRDPQFYAVPSNTRAKNGRLRVMGFPPIGVMSLAAVLKRAGHDVVMFDQANPETPDAFIIGKMLRQRPDLVGLSFLSTTSYPYAKILARQMRAADANVKIAFGGVFATLNARLIKMQVPEVDFVCRGDGEHLILDLLDRLDDPATVTGVTWQEGDGTLRHNPDRPLERSLDQWPYPDREGLPIDFIESMPLDVPAVLSLDRFTTMQTSRGCPWPCVFCDIPIFNEGKWRARGESTWSGNWLACSGRATERSSSWTTTSCSSPGGSRRSAAASASRGSPSSGAARGGSTRPAWICFRRWTRPTAGR